MKLAGTSVPLRDMTRWNRAGLSRLRYTGEGAAEFTEALRIAHLLHYAEASPRDETTSPDTWARAFETGTFENGDSLELRLARLSSRFSRPVMDGAPPSGADHAARLLAQYRAVLTDPSAQISRAFADALHVLSETLNAYANEGTLRTATQPVHLNHLLSLIGFRPRLAASARTPVAYILKPDQGMTDLAAGLAFETPHPSGAELLTFEALERITAHPALNAMRVAGWDQSQDRMASDLTVLELDSASAFSRGLPGTGAILSDGNAQEAVFVTAADRSDASIQVTRARRGQLNGFLRSIRISTSPALSLAPRPRGRQWLNFDSPPKVFTGMTLMVGPTRAALEPVRVRQVSGRDVEIARLITSGKWPDNIKVAFTATQGIRLRGGGNAFDKLSYEADEPLETLIDLDDDQVYLDGPEALALRAGDPVIFHVNRTDQIAANAEIVFRDDAGVGLRLQGTWLTADRIRMVQAAFRDSSGLRHDRRSSEPVMNADSTLSLNLDAAHHPLVQPGRALILASDPQTTPSAERKAVVGHVTRVLSTGPGTITLSLEVADTDLRKGHAIVHGNVANFGHGKSLPAMVIGSGDAAQTSQVMDIGDMTIATRPNPDFPGGIAADLDVSVDGRIWQQIAPDAGIPEDSPAYQVEVSGEGRVSLRFLHPLPTGTDNVMLTRIRTGAGDSGNDIPAYSVTNLQPKSPAIDAIVQPFTPQSGADREDANALRGIGRSHFALFDRALAAQDFALLARTHAGVWHAHATLSRQGAGRGGTSILLTVVPAGGLSLDPLREDLIAMLEARSIPGTQIELLPFLPAPFAALCDIRLLPGHAESSTIRTWIESELMARFGLQVRPLGARLYTAEIVSVIEAHPAVSSVRVSLQGRWTGAAPGLERSASGGIEAMRPQPRMSVYLAGIADLDLRFIPATSAGGL